MAENYLKTQEDLAAQIAKGIVNFKKSPKDRVTCAYIETRLENLESQWTLFHNTHRKIVYELKKEDYALTDYHIKGVYDATEEEYLNYKSLLRESLSKLKPKKDDSGKNSTDSRKIFVKLPEIVLPKFSGKYSEWANYKDMFKSLIERNEMLDDVQKLHYLKGSLTGDAEALVRNIAITADNYKICWTRLVSRYENKRSMANSIIRRLMNQKSLTQESAISIRHLLDTTSECLQSLRNLGVQTSSWDIMLIYVISQKLDPVSRAKWEAKMSETGQELPKYKEFEEFLETRFRSLEYKVTEREKDNTNITKHSNAVTAVTSVCAFCSDKHKLSNCKKFFKENVDARRQFVSNQHLCYNCLSSEHSVYGCTVSTTCRLCKRRHHTLLHPKTPQVSKPGPSHESSKIVAVVSKQEEMVQTQEVESPTTVTSCISTSRKTVLLATALVNVSAQTNSGSASVLRSLLDQGSEASFVTESAAQFLGLKRIKENVKVSGVGGSGSVESKSSVNILITSRNDPSFSTNVKAHVLEKITAVLPSNKIDVEDSQMNVLTTLKLADPTFNRPGCIDLLLGAEVYSKIMMNGLIRGKNGSFIAQKTKLGWVLSGAIEGSTSNDKQKSQVQCHTVTVDDAIDDDEMLKKFWELESEPGTSKKILTAEEERCEELFLTTTERDEFGRYIVKLPFRTENPSCKYGGSCEIARKRFLHLEKRLLKDPSLKVEYSKVIKEYLAMGHMEICEDKDKDGAVYLPHHAVVREDKTSTKVRVVFDASCKGLNGVSLNSELMIGPRIQPELRQLVMRWRCYPISLVADIVKMYRQVKVTDDDTDFQRILWRDNPDEELQHYKLMRVTFGTSAAPHLAVRALQQVAHDEGTEFPLAADRVIGDFYVDDLMTGCHSVAEGVQVVDQMTKLLDRGGFPLQKWSSNNKELLEAISNTTTHTDQNIDLKTDDGKIMKILGLIWNRETDEFHFKVNLPPQSGSPVTKRKVISDIAKLFDPIGWLAPAIITAKVFIQRLWLSGINWDDQLPSDLLRDWLRFREDLVNLENFEIPRWINFNKKEDQVLELHGFSDASNVAFAAVVYSRVVDKDKNVHINLITSKTRVAPIKQVSTPRLELCGASLLAKLLSEVANTLNVTKSNIHAWSDSTIVLAWLSSHPSRWKTFVANRVSDILTTMDGNQWSHVKSEDNPADCASRGLSPAECAQSQLWKHGPNWLHGLVINYQKDHVTDTKLEEKKAKVKCHVTTNDEGNHAEDLMSRFSSLKKLIRVLSFCRRILQWRQSEKKIRRGGSLKVEELNETYVTCIKMCQQTHFPEEIENLKTNKPVGKKSKLSSLLPYLDEDGVLRVGGRLNNALISEEMKHPIIIPHDSHLTNLIVDEAHQRTLHGGPQMMLNYLRSKYWIIGAKSAVRQFVRKCVMCVRHSKEVNQQQMGQLPAARVTSHRPFQRSGVDYAGPINVRTTKGRGHRSTKGYICVFICMATKAIHLEVVSDMTSEAFLAAFRRFTARRGHVSEMWSDNGTTFVGAARQLTELLDFERSSVAIEIADWLATNGTAWHFIPPHSPNFGGLWEAAVKSTKFHLARVIGNSTLTFEEMTTTLSQIEACLNSRPLSQLSSDPKDPSPLTPGHFLVGEPLVLVPDMNYESSTISSLKRWHLTQRMVQEFWRRWSEEYLTQLQHRYKWTNQIDEPDIGAVVLIKEDGLPPARWLLGVIVEKYPGTDGITRVVGLKCKGQVLKRPISKLIFLPITD